MNLKMLLVQPISLELATFIKILPEYVDIDALKNLTADFTPCDEWLRRILRDREYTGGFKKLKLDLDDHSEAFEQDIKDEFPDDVAATLLSTLIRGPKIKLFFDTRFDYFVLVYELEWDLTRKQMERCFQVFSQNEKDDSYNKLRNIFVQERTADPLSRWNTAVRKQVNIFLSNAIQQIYTSKVSQDKIIFQTNTGNISFFLYDQDPQGLSVIRGRLQDIHNFAEINAKDVRPISLPNDTSHIFGGRFHTIVSSGEDPYDRYAAIQFHAQFMYCYLRTVNTLFDYVGGTVVVSKDSKALVDYRVAFEDLIIKIEQMSIYNEMFKNEIENDNERLYQPAQANWNLENLLSQTSKFISFFKDYLDILYERDEKQRQNRLNGILSIIAVLQLLTLIGFAISLAQTFPQRSSKLYFLGIDITAALLTVTAIVTSLLLMIVVFFSTKLLFKRLMKGKA